MLIQHIQQISPELNLFHYNEIPVLELKHSLGEAKISLQGAQLLSWKPASESQDVLWLSEIDPFQLGVAIRGGIPLCYPWFGGAKQPPHGTARIALWQLTDYSIAQDKVRLEFSYFDQQQVLQAKVCMLFDDKCEVQFTHCTDEQVQLALHSYFNVGDITQVEVHHLPTVAFNAVSQQKEQYPSPRKIDQHIDCIYALEQSQNLITDASYQRQIEIEHHNATELVLWNPWHKEMSAMQSQDYKNMLCLETARLSQLLNKGDMVSVVLKITK